MSTIKKAIFPVAGLGTRFLPATKSIPKEMLIVLDRPVIEWAVIEASKSGIEEMIFVTSSKKDPAYVLGNRFSFIYYRLKPEQVTTLAEIENDLNKLLKSIRKNKYLSTLNKLKL